MRQCFHGMLDLQKYKSSDLYISHIKKDPGDLCNVVEILSDTLINYFTHSNLVCILNGYKAAEEVSESLINAKKSWQERSDNTHEGKIGRRVND